MALFRRRSGSVSDKPMQFKSDPFVMGDPNAPGRPWWVRHRMRALLATMLIPLVVGAIGFTATWLVVQSGVKSHPAYGEALALVRASPEVAAALGPALEPGFYTPGGVGEEPGTFQCTFSVSGERGDAGVRVYAREGQGGAWTVTYLDVGLRGSGGEAVVVLRDGEKPERFVEDVEE